MLRLEGERVRLRPFRQDEVEPVWRISQTGVDGFMPDPRRPTRRTIAKRVERSGALVDGRLDLAIEAEGRLVGEIDARQPVGALPEGVFEFGIAVYERDDRGKGYGEEAVWLLTRHLFDAEGAERVQATTDVDNDAMRGVLEKLGFTLEGVLRAYGHGEDGRRDYAMYAVTRSDHQRG